MLATASFSRSSVQASPIVATFAGALSLIVYLSVGNVASLVPNSLFAAYLLPIIWLPNMPGRERLRPQLLELLGDLDHLVLAQPAGGHRAGQRVLDLEPGRVLAVDLELAVDDLQARGRALPPGLDVDRLLLGAVGRPSWPRPSSSATAAP